MTPSEKDIIAEVLRAQGLNPSSFGLRFDRVAVRLLRALRSFADEATPDGRTVLVSLTAPIRSPALTLSEVKGRISAGVSSGEAGEARFICPNGDEGRLRLVQNSAAPGVKFMGFVHNRAAAPDVLLGSAEAWLGRR